MKTIILARVSTEEQKEVGNSLPAQLIRLQNYARDKELKIIKELSFDESAFKTERKEFSKVVENLKQSKEPLALCCDKIDRLIRNFTKDLVTLEELRKKGKLELHFPSDNIVLHKDSPASDLFRFHIGIGLASYYSNAISDNVKRAYENKIEKGEWIGKAHIGYLNKPDENGNKNIVPDPARAHFIVRIFERYATGNSSTRALKKEMEELGLRGTGKGNKPLSYSMIHNVLRNPFYYGIMRIKGRLHPHKYQPLIPKLLFNKCQQVMDSYHKKPFKYAGKPFVLRGMIKCADCGCTITPEKTKGHTYYSCTNFKGFHNKRDYIREEDLMKPIYDVLKNIQLPNDKIKAITEDLKHTHEAKNRFHEQSLRGLRQEYEKIEKRIQKLFDMRLDDDQSITKDMFNNKLKELKEKQAEIRMKMECYDQADEKFYITANTVLNLAKKSLEIFKSSEVAEKRQLLNFLLQNLQLKDRKLMFTLKTPFDTVLQANKCSSMLP